MPMRPLLVLAAAAVTASGVAVTALRALRTRRVNRSVARLSGASLSEASLTGSAARAASPDEHGLPSAHEMRQAAADTVEEVAELAADAAVALVRTAEEWANTLTHGAGLVASAVGAGVLVALAVASGSAALVTSAAVFGASLVVLYGASTAYHAVLEPERKVKMRLADHLAILYLIAGTYTPFALVGIGGRTGALLLGLVWSFAAAGTLFKIFSRRRFENNMTWFYVAMGWIVVLFLKPLVASLSGAALAWLIGGGLAYSGGVFFFLRDRGYDHAVWHGFVLAGSVCHYLAVLSLRASVA